MPDNLPTCINYLLSQGWTEQQIAIQLNIEVSTVKENNWMVHHDTELGGTTSPKDIPPQSPVSPVSPSDPGTTTFQSGAVRSSELKGLRYDLISPVALRRLAAAYGEGAVKYSAFNCENGFPIFGDEGLYTHAMNHLLKFAWGDTTEDHLSHLLWNVAMMCHSQECWPELNAGTSRAELVPAEKRMDVFDRQKLEELTKCLSDTVQAMGNYVNELPGKEPLPYPQRADIPADFEDRRTIVSTIPHEHTLRGEVFVDAVKVNPTKFLSDAAAEVMDAERAKESRYVRHGEVLVDAGEVKYDIDSVPRVELPLPSMPALPLQPNRDFEKEEAKRLNEYYKPSRGPTSY